MKYGERISSFLWIVIGLLFCIFSFQHGFYKDDVLGSAPFAFLAGIILVLLASFAWFLAFKEVEFHDAHETWIVDFSESMGCQFYEVRWAQ